MQAIRTAYHGPTDKRASAMSAACASGRIRLPYDHEKDMEGNHKAACMALVKKLRTWHPCRMVGGSFQGEMYWVNRDMDSPRVTVVR